MSQGKLLYKEFARIAWNSGNGPGDLFVSTPQISMITDKPARMMRASVRIRSLPSGGLAVLAYDPALTEAGRTPFFYRFDATGNLLAQLALNSPGDPGDIWRIQDFMFDQAGALYLLELLRSEKRRNLVRKLDSSGKLAWLQTAAEEVAEPLSLLAGKTDKLLMDARSTCYLASTRHYGLVSQFEGHSGQLKIYAEIGEWRGDLFMDGAGKLYFVRFVPTLKERQWVAYDPVAGQETSTTVDPNHFVLPVAVDDEGQAYTTRGMSLMCVSAAGAVKWQIWTDNIVVDPETASLYISRYEKEAGQIQVQHWDAAGFKQELLLQLPADMQAARGGAYRLIYLDQGDFVVQGGESPIQLGNLLVYSPDGALKGTVVPAPETHAIEFSLQAPATWAVDLRGDVYLPVLGPTHLHIIKLTVAS